MEKEVTEFGKLCRKLRIEKGWSMTDVALTMGYKQNHITQIELGKFNPSIRYLKKCLDVYEIPKSDKANFITLALSNPKRLTLEIENVKIIPKKDLVKLLIVLFFNLEEPYPDTKEWDAVSKIIEKLKA